MTIIAKGSRRKEGWYIALIFAVSMIGLGRALLWPGGIAVFTAEASVRDQLLLLSAPFLIGVGIWWVIMIRRQPAPDLVIAEGRLQQTGWFAPLPVDDIVGVAFKPGNLFTRRPGRLMLDLRNGSARELSTIRLVGNGDQIARAIAAELKFDVLPPPHQRPRGDFKRTR
ncbi:hypothetical protein [Brevundimonas sp.]|uniref:hypothetical protein n=1 Tax=Brevundimonas sp. TaxID=1871086 RepID=UPI002ED91C9D